MGLRHGLYCLGCCWAAMGVLFVVGVMNLAWVGLLTAFVLLERFGRRHIGGVMRRASKGWAAWFAVSVIARIFCDVCRWGREVVVQKIGLAPSARLLTAVN
jgi:predicted metal-binding membrane protein